MASTDNTTNGGWYRIRVALADNYTLVLGVLVVLAAAGGYLTYTTHVDPGTRTETHEGPGWQSSGQFTHQATVVNETTALAEGTVLQDRTTYFRSVTPRLNGSFGYTYTASEGGNVSADTTVSLVLRSVETAENGNTTVYWEVERRLGERTASLAPSEETTVPFSVNVRAAGTEAERIDAEFGGTPGELQTVVVARTELSGTRNGQPVDVTRNYRLPIRLDGSVYRVDDPGPVTKSDSQTERVTAPAEYGRLRGVGAPLLALLSGGVAVRLTVARRNGQLSVSDHKFEWMGYQADREEFDDWITAGAVPEPDGTTLTVDVESLGGLVDVAIDTDSRVIEDTERDVFVVLDGNQWYRYHAPTEPLADADRDLLVSPDGANHAAVEGKDGHD